MVKERSTEKDTLALGSFALHNFLSCWFKDRVKNKYFTCELFALCAHEVFMLCKVCW